MMENEFWDYLDQLVERSEVVIDRPQGSIHPRYDNVAYPLDYGYLQGSVSGDGGGLDVWIGSNPEKHIDEVICTIDLGKND